MNVKVTGCKDCPLFNCTGSEYGIYCHHPERPVDVSEWSGEPADFLDIELSAEKLEELRIKYRKDGEGWIYITTKLERYPLPEKGDLRIKECPIYNNEDYNPITPNWCPLNKESITIEKI